MKGKCPHCGRSFSLKDGRVRLHRARKADLAPCAGSGGLPWRRATGGFVVRFKDAAEALALQRAYDAVYGGAVARAELDGRYEKGEAGRADSACSAIAAALSDDSRPRRSDLQEREEIEEEERIRREDEEHG